MASIDPLDTIDPLEILAILQNIDLSPRGLGLNVGFGAADPFNIANFTFPTLANPDATAAVQAVDQIRQAATPQRDPEQRTRSFSAAERRAFQEQARQSDSRVTRFLGALDEGIQANPGALVGLISPGLPGLLAAAANREETGQTIGGVIRQAARESSSTAPQRNVSAGTGDPIRDSLIRDILQIAGTTTTAAKLRQETTATLQGLLRIISRNAPRSDSGADRRQGGGTTGTVDVGGVGRTRGSATSTRERGGPSLV